MYHPHCHYGCRVRAVYGSDYFSSSAGMHDFDLVSLITRKYALLATCRGIRYVVARMYHPHCHYGFCVRAVYGLDYFSSSAGRHDLEIVSLITRKYALATF